MSSLTKKINSNLKNKYFAHLHLLCHFLQFMHDNSRVLRRLSLADDIKLLCPISFSAFQVDASNNAIYVAFVSIVAAEQLK
jgi:hypothetical protein